MWSIATAAAVTPLPVSHLQFITISRRLLEQLLRERVVAEHPGKLVILGGSKVAGLVWSKDGGAVTGGQGIVHPGLLLAPLVGDSRQHGQVAVRC